VYKSDDENEERDPYVTPPSTPDAGRQYRVATGPLPVCEYTGVGDNDEPCEEPAVVRRWSSIAVVIAAAFGAITGALLAAAALVWIFGLWPGIQRYVPDSPGQSLEVAPIVIEPGESVDIAAAVAAKATPSVVNVRVEQGFLDPFTGRTGYRETGNGSGVIIREEGYILTNYHVISGADKIIVTVGIDDVEAQIAGLDPSTDLAVLKIRGGPFPAADIGSSAELRVGEFVVAVGSPFGLEKTVTSGIISALQRSSFAQGSRDITAYTNLIQTDAAINPGNSGGALLDAEGRLIGINTLIQSPAGAVGTPQSAGIGFAIPIDSAIDVAVQLIETGRAVHPFLGISSMTIDQATAAQFRLRVTRGALVRFVEPGSPADIGGIERGDIVTKVDDRDIVGAEDVFAAVRAREVGDTVRVTVVRGDTQRELEVVLESDVGRAD